MKHDDTDFTRAWNSLTTSGEMSGEPPRPFTPVAATLKSVVPP